MGERMNTPMPTSTRERRKKLVRRVGITKPTLLSRKLARRAKRRRTGR